MDEKRMVGDYTVLNSMYIGHKEILLCENTNSRSLFLSSPISVSGMGGVRGIRKSPVETFEIASTPNTITRLGMWMIRETSGFAFAASW